jgi:hypothetical protein
MVTVADFAPPGIVTVGVEGHATVGVSELRETTRPPAGAAEFVWIVRTADLLPVTDGKS